MEKFMIPKGVQLFIERFLRLIQYLFLSCVWIGFLVSLSTYHAFDESLNVAHMGPIQNKMGIVGAYLSDFMLQTFGYGSYWLLGLYLIYLIQTAFQGTSPLMMRRFLPMAFLSFLFAGLVAYGIFYVHMGFIIHIIFYWIFTGLKHLNLQAFLPFISVLWGVCAIIFAGFAL
ncbi:MAG: DNA translocase FtsK 4TM domain-containing protein, partial [Alphaproteobacteria bacterium]|nr:DNA translocase FtsK 4TM domain-containing protein [Alphaproteobacteria bacterium]